MGTRGAWGFVVDGQPIISFHLKESMPSGLGVWLLDWALDQPSWGEIRVRVQGLELVLDDQAEVTDEDAQRHPYLASSVGWTWEDALQGAEGEPGETFEAGVITHDPTLPYQPGFVEWMYLFDLDDDAYEVYSDRPPAGVDPRAGRFWAAAEEGTSALTLVARYSLHALPRDFTARLRAMYE